MLASILVAALVGTFMFSTVRMRRRERRRDSIARFADARKAMSVTQGRPAVRVPHVTAHESGDAEHPGVVVRNGSATLLDPMARRHIAESRRSFRRDPEVLARRPTVAMLPRLLTAHDGDGAKPVGSADAPAPPVVSLPAPRSEAS